MSRNVLARSFFPAATWKAADAESRNATLTAPSPGTILTTSPVTFAWTPVRGAVDYWIGVGTAYGQSDIWGDFSRGKTSIAVDISKYLNRKTIHVQIYTAFPDYNLKPGSGAKFTFVTAPPSPKKGSRTNRTSTPASSVLTH